jgi:hypothetical protein
MTRRSTGATAGVLEAVVVRSMREDWPACEVCGGPITGERGLDWALHHRRGRDGTPDSHTPQNQLVVHGADNVSACHGRIHRNRGNESIDNGWLISRNGVNRDPLMIPVLIDHGSRWTYLAPTGEYSDEPPS